MEQVDIAIIGGGPAGMAAAIAAHEAGARNVLILERDYRGLGGILNQCIHTGFGIQVFNAELTGPEYAERYADQVRALGIRVELGAMVIDLSPDRVITSVGGGGLSEIRAKAVILAMGCRERPRGALNLPGSRPAGVFTAGTAQKFINLDGYLPGREAVILGSGDIGLIMARRLTLEGARVRAVAELMPYSNGLKRNIVQCLDDFGIPLLLSHTVTRVIGRKRVEGVEISQVGPDLKPVPGSGRHYACDTLLLSVGLIPENELARAAGVALSPATGGAVAGESLQTGVEGIFACGNALHVHDLADGASLEAAQAGRHAACFAAGRSYRLEGALVRAGAGVRYTVPSLVNPANLDGSLKVHFRVNGVYRDHAIAVYFDGVREQRRRARILTPGEMASVVLSRESFAGHPGLREVTLAVEKD
ncbi:MAG: NAD(P)/FAD-dependent oxidoreductase [Planctomycetes bacterium]|nr:NAD(P)/FAD-dependent oxidoreductase [Planctomycetota bacterium]